MQWGGASLVPGGTPFFALMRADVLERQAWNTRENLTVAIISKSNF